MDVALAGIGGALSVRSYRALRSGGRLVVFGHYSTLAHGRRSRRGWLTWYTSTATVALAGLLSPRRHVLAYRIAKLRDRHPDWFRDDLEELIRLVRAGTIDPVVAERLPLAEARRAHELLDRSAAKGSSSSFPRVCSPRSFVRGPRPATGSPKRSAALDRSGTRRRPCGRR